MKTAVMDHRLHLGDTSYLALGGNTTSIGDGDSGVGTRAKQKNSGTPLPSAPKVRIGAPRTQERFKLWGVLKELR